MGLDKIQDAQDKKGGEEGVEKHSEASPTITVTLNDVVFDWATQGSECSEKKATITKRYHKRHIFFFFFLFSFFLSFFFFLGRVTGCGRKDKFLEAHTHVPESVSSPTGSVTLNKYFRPTQQSLTSSLWVQLLPV